MSCWRTPSHLSQYQFIDFDLFTGKIFCNKSLLHITPEKTKTEWCHNSRATSLPMPFNTWRGYICVSSFVTRVTRQHACSIVTILAQQCSLGCRLRSLLRPHYVTADLCYSSLSSRSATRHVVDLLFPEFYPIYLSLPPPFFVWSFFTACLLLRPSCPWRY